MTTLPSSCACIYLRLQQRQAFPSAFSAGAMFTDYCRQPPPSALQSCTRPCYSVSRANCGRADRSRYHCYAAEAPSRRDGKVFLVDFCLVTFLLVASTDRYGHCCQPPPNASYN